MLILSVKNLEDLTPAQKAVKLFCDYNCENYTLFIGNELFNPPLTRLPNSDWVVVGFEGLGSDKLDVSKLKIEYRNTFSGWEYVLSLNTSDSGGLFNNEEIQFFEVDQKISYDALSTILKHSNLPRYTAGYGVGDGENYCNIPGLPRDAYIRELIDPQWVPVRWLRGEGDAGYEFVRCPDELWKYVDEDDPDFLITKAREKSEND